MQTLEILIEENANGAVCPMEVAADAPVSALLPALVEELKLPQTDLFGNRLAYMLRCASGGPILPENKSLAASGIQPGTRLALNSYVLNSPIVSQSIPDNVQTPASSTFHTAMTLADPESFALPGKDTSAKIPVVKKERRWTRRGLLMLGGAALGTASIGMGNALYHTLIHSNPLMTKPTTGYTTPKHPTPTKPFMPTTAKALLSFTQHHQTVRSLTWSPDGKMLASGANDAQFLLWNRDGTIQMRMQQTGTVRVVAWSPDRQQIAIGAGNIVTFLAPFTGTTRSTHQHTAPVISLAWSPHYPLRLVSGGQDKQAIVWDATTHVPQTIFTRHTTTIESASWSSDGQTIGTSSHGGAIRVWNSANGMQLHGLFLDAQIPMRTLAFAPSGAQLAVGGDDGIVRFWNGLVCQHPQQGQLEVQCTDIPQRLHAHSRPIRALAWSPDGRFLATGADDGILAIWYAAQNQALLLKFITKRQYLLYTGHPMENRSLQLLEIRLPSGDCHRRRDSKFVGARYIGSLHCGCGLHKTNQRLQIIKRPHRQRIVCTWHSR